MRRAGDLTLPRALSSTPALTDETLRTNVSTQASRRVLRVGVGLIALGLLVRFLYAFPVHKYAPDADSLNMGLRALSILDGDLVVFYSAAQIGALEAYLHAAVFALFGASRATISITPLIVGVATLVVFFLFAREVLPPAEGLLALAFLALAPPAYLAWTYMPNSYPETLFFSATTLWLAARIARRGPERSSSLALGLSIGLGWWNSPLTAGCALAAVVWLIAVRREARRPAFWVFPLAGGVLGASPWIYYNLRYGFPSVWQVVRPGADTGSVVASAGRFLGDNLPTLAVGMDPLGSGKPGMPLQAALQLPAAAAYLAALGGLALGWGAGRAKESLRPRLLLGLVASVVAGLFVFSESGRFPGPTVRYVLPLVFVLCTALAALVVAVWRRSRPAAIVIVCVVLLFNLSGYYWPWTEQRRVWAENRRGDERLLAFVESNGIAWICGGYWTVYPFNFLSRASITAVPYERQFDFYDLSRKLPARAHGALVSNDPHDLEAWAHRAGLSGRVSAVRPGYFVFVPDRPGNDTSATRLYLRLVGAARR